MFLSCFAQPTLFSNRKTLLNFEDNKNAPLLLCHKNALNGKILPAEWSGSIYATQEVLLQLEQQNTYIKSACTQALCPNEVYNINIINDEKYKSKNIELTALSWDKENILYLIKDDNVVNLLTDQITEDFSIFVQNRILRNNIKSGIDVLYVNDGVYHKSSELQNFPTECLLGALVTLVRPRYVKGLISDKQLPLHITNCCVDLRDTFFF